MDKIRIFPTDTANKISTYLNKIKFLPEGFYETQCTTGSMTIHGITLPNGICTTSVLNRNYEHEFNKHYWSELNENIQLEILLNVIKNHSW